MSPYLIALVSIGAFVAILIILNERVGLFRDTFTSRTAKIIAYVWLALFLIILSLLIVGSAMTPPKLKDLQNVSFYSLFTLHIILIVFLFVWWLLIGRPPIRQYLNIQSERPGDAVLMGLAIGLGGWAITIALALVVGFILQQSGLMPKSPEPSPMIGWMAQLPVWKKILIVMSAMTVEEAFFRGWLQKRIGLIASTLLFALAHLGLGQPFLLIGIAIISLIIGFTFYRTKNLIPGIVAHGVFDAIQIFVIIPIAYKALGMG